MDLALLHVGLCAAAAVGFIAIRAVRHVRQLRQQLAGQEALVRALERDLEAVCVGARGMGETVQQIEDRLRRLTERQDQMALREPDQGVYQQAIRLVQRGAGVEELVSTCGLQRSEAELIHVLHQRERPSPPLRDVLRARATT
jgi:hypothetical protein